MALDLTISLAQALFGAKIISYKICLIENRSAVARVGRGEGGTVEGDTGSVLVPMEFFCLRTECDKISESCTRRRTLRACEKW